MVRPRIFAPTLVCKNWCFVKKNKSVNSLYNQVRNHHNHKCFLIYSPVSRFLSPGWFTNHLTLVPSSVVVAGNISCAELGASPLFFRQHILPVFLSPTLRFHQQHDLRYKKISSSVLNILHDKLVTSPTDNEWEDNDGENEEKKHGERHPVTFKKSSVVDVRNYKKRNTYREFIIK